MVGFIDDQGRTSTRRAFWLSTLFAGGILSTIGVIGAVTAALGRMMGDVGVWGNYFVAAVFFIIGLHLLGVIELPFSGASPGATKKKGLLAALILGLVFGILVLVCVGLPLLLALRDRKLIEFDVDPAALALPVVLDVPEDIVEYERTVAEPDQWTLTQAGALPLHKFEVRDGAF